MTSTGVKNSLESVFGILPDWMKVAIMLSALPMGAVLAYGYVVGEDGSDIAPNVQRIEDRVASIDERMGLFQAMLLTAQTDNAVQDRRLDALDGWSTSAKDAIRDLTELSKSNRSQIDQLWRRNSTPIGQLTPFDYDGPLIGAASN